MVGLVARTARRTVEGEGDLAGDLTVVDRGHCALCESVVRRQSRSRHGGNTEDGSEESTGVHGGEKGRREGRRRRGEKDLGGSSRTRMLAITDGGREHLKGFGRAVP